MNDVFTSLRLFVLSLLICSGAYSGVILAVASFAAPVTRQGSLTRNGEGTIVGSRLLAQGFSRPEYFWPRPSACDYNASATGGSNLSPANPAIADRAKEIISRYQPGDGDLVPAELVLASGGGMDPHITVAAADFQASRVARARNMDEQDIRELIRSHIDSPTMAALGGEPLVNVLELNLALDGRE